MSIESKQKSSLTVKIFWKERKCKESNLESDYLYKELGFT